MAKAFQVGHPVIRSRAEEVSFPLSAENKAVIQKLTDDMRAIGLVGMAGPQVGESVRIFVTEIRKTRHRNAGEDPLRVFINPKLTGFSEETETGYEGCGSVGDSGLFGEVERPAEVSVEWQDENGNTHTGTFSGLLARIIQHEYDHIEGIVFLDKLKTTKTVMSACEYRRAMGVE